jgi:hypothetical protein
MGKYVFWNEKYVFSHWKVYRKLYFELFHTKCGHWSSCLVSRLGFRYLRIITRNFMSYIKITVKVTKFKIKKFHQSHIKVSTEKMRFLQLNSIPKFYKCLPQIHMSLKLLLHLKFTKVRAGNEKLKHFVVFISFLIFLMLNIHFLLLLLLHLVLVC